MKKPSGKKPD